MENEIDIDLELLKALKVARPMQLWGFHRGRFVLDTGPKELFYTRVRIVEILRNEILDLSTSTKTLLDALALADEKAKRSVYIAVDVELFESLILIVINAEEERTFPPEVREELEEGNKAVLHEVVEVLNNYKRMVGQEEIH